MSHFCQEKEAESFRLFAEYSTLFIYFLFLKGGQIMSSNKGMYDRLLTPEQGCGISKVRNTRIVGGAPAKNGAWPWLVDQFSKKVQLTSNKFTSIYSLLFTRMALLFYVYGVTFT